MLDFACVVMVELSDHLKRSFTRGPINMNTIHGMSFQGNPMKSGFQSLLVAVSVACLLSLPLGAQTVTGRILGVITDPTGATVGGANVTVTDVERGISRTFTTDPSGTYAAPNLQAGVYKVHVEAKGFKTVDRTGIQLEVASDAQIDIALQAGNVTDTVTVNEDVPLVNVTSATLGGTLSNKEINDLPLNGRNYENLLQLRPGVVRYPGGGFSTTSTNGLRAEDNAYVIEGLFNSEPYSGQGVINGAGIAGDSATILPIDAIQEFNLQENPPAEYGWKPGAIVNVGLKSGTNGVHGSGFIFGRDGALDARNFFNTKPNPKNPRTLEQFGGSFGGPIVKDKAFFFGAYEGQRYNVGQSFGGITSPATVPFTTPAGNCIYLATGDCSSSIPDVIADLHAGGITVSPASLKIAGCTDSGGTVTCDGTGFPTNKNQTINIVNGFPNIVHADNIVAKIDYHLSDRNAVNGMFFFGNNSGTVEDFPELQPKWLSKIHTRAQVVGGSWVWIPNARLVNEARVGYNRLYQPTLPGDLGTPASSYGLNTGVQAGPNTGGLPRIGFAGFFFPGLGGFKWPKLQGPDTIIQFVDHVSYTAGKHSFKFGGELHRDGVQGGAYGNARGSITFTGGNTPDPNNPGGFLNTTQLEDFFSGWPLKATVLSGDPKRDMSNWAYAAFAQDDWRVSRSLTLNFGLRYEFNTVLKEAHNQIGNFDPNVGFIQVGKQVSSPYNADHKDFAPRVGFAWDVTGKGSTVLRGGGGIVYETVNWQSFLAFNNSFGLTSDPTGALLNGTPGPGSILVGNLTVFPSASWDNGPLYGNLSPSNLACNDGSVAHPGQPCAIFAVDRNLTTPYVSNWTVSLQHAFNPNLSLEVAYVGNHGSNLTGIRDINQPPVGAGWTTNALKTGSLDVCLASAPAYNNCASDGGAEQAARPLNAKFPYLSNIFQMGNVYKSNYNGLQATLSARNYKGLSMVAGYTYSHSLDDLGANWHFGYGAGLPQDSTHLNREYASSDFDLRHRLTVSLTYAIPGRDGLGQMLKGWSINSIISVYSPQPWGTIDLGTDAAGTGPLPVSPPASSPIRWNFFGKPAEFKSSAVGIPHFSGASNAACAAKALALDGNTPGAATAALNLFGCYAQGNSVLIPPALGQFGNLGRNSFRDTGFRNVDFSVNKAVKLGERASLQFRAEFFNIFNHPNLANPYGGQNGFGLNDPSAGSFGCGCATPDTAAANPVVGSGGSRAIQLGLKAIF